MAITQWAKVVDQIDQLITNNNVKQTTTQKPGSLVLANANHLMFAGLYGPAKS